MAFSYELTIRLGAHNTYAAPVDVRHVFLYLPLRTRPSAGRAAAVGMAQIFAILTAPSMRPSAHIIWTRLGLRFHFAAASLTDKYSMLPPFGRKKSSRQNMAGTRMTANLSRAAGCHPRGKRPFSFASLPFGRFAEIYFLLLPSI